MLKIFTVKQEHITRVITARKKRLNEDKKGGFGLHSLSKSDREKIVRCHKCGIPFQVGDRAVSKPPNGGRKSRWWHVTCAAKVGLL